MEQKEITTYKFETISVLAVISCWSILMFSFALLFNVGQNLFLYLFFLVLGFILAYAMCKYFTGTFEIIINDQQQTAIVRWDKKIILTFVKEQSIDLKSLRNFKEWSGRVNNRVNFYFIDTISACGGTISASIVGCGEFPGNDFVVESSFAAGSFGGELLAHELGHNLGLRHLAGGLMNASLNRNTTLTTSEVSIIRNSRLVKSDGQGFWIDINPVLILASTPVPEPSTLVLMLLSVGFLVRKNIKK